jgi:hypothetical protein
MKLYILFLKGQWVGRNLFVFLLNKGFRMTTTVLKQNIAKVISDIHDKDFLEAVNTIVSNKADEPSFELSSEMENELDLRKDRHLKGVSKSYSWQNVKKAALSNYSS